MGVPTLFSYSAGWVLAFAFMLFMPASEARAADVARADVVSLACMRWVVSGDEPSSEQAVWTDASGSSEELAESTRKRLRRCWRPDTTAFHLLLRMEALRIQLPQSTAPRVRGVGALPTRSQFLLMLSGPTRLFQKG